MAKVILTISDNDTQVDIHALFDPPMVDTDMPTPAQIEVLGILDDLMRHNQVDQAQLDGVDITDEVRESMGQRTGMDAAPPTTGFVNGDDITLN